MRKKTRKRSTNAKTLPHLHSHVQKHVKEWEEKAQDFSRNCMEPFCKITSATQLLHHFITSIPSYTKTHLYVTISNMVCERTHRRAHAPAAPNATLHQRLASHSPINSWHLHTTTYTNKHTTGQWLASRYSPRITSWPTTHNHLLDIMISNIICERPIGAHTLRRHQMQHVARGQLRIEKLVHLSQAHNC